MLVSFSSGLSLCNRKDLPVAVICLHGPCINFQMRKESPSQCPYSKSLIRQDKSPSGVLGLWPHSLWSPEIKRHDTFSIYLSSYFLSIMARILSLIIGEFLNLFECLLAIYLLLIFFYQVVIFCCLLVGLLKNILNISLSNIWKCILIHNFYF